MRIGYVVGGLGRGGAELQVLRLAAGLVDRGHSVSVIAYDGPAVLDDAFREAGVEVVSDSAKTRVEKVRAVRRWAQRSSFDVVHGILRRASTLALLARWPARRPAVVVTDYSSATYGRRDLALFASLAAFALADRVVTEVELNRSSLERLAPWLRGKTHVIRNGVDTSHFVPRRSGRIDRDAREGFVFSAVGTVSRVKNPLRVIEAVETLRKRGYSAFRVDWYGRDSLSTGDDTGERARALVTARGLHDHFVFHGDTPEIERAYHRSDALIHASTYEGFPNAVAEAMASGLPIAVSRVSDLPLVVTEAENGFVFDETDPASIADAMERLMEIPAAERAAMGARSRATAVRWFGVVRFIDDYEELYRTMSRGARS